MSFTSGNDINILQSSDNSVVGAGEGDDRYLLDASTLSPDQIITISDAKGGNTLHLVGGLEIVGSRVTANAIELTLNNGAIVRVLGAETFKYLTGGNALTTAGSMSQGFDEFVVESLGVAGGVPLPGEPLVVNSAVTVQEDGGTISGSAEAGSTVTVYDTDGTLVLGTAIADSQGVFPIVTGSLVDGVHAITATAKNSAGGISTASSALSLIIDSQAPEASVDASSVSIGSSVIARSNEAGSKLYLVGIDAEVTDINSLNALIILGQATSLGAGGAAVIPYENGLENGVYIYVYDGDGQFTHMTDIVIKMVGVDANSIAAISDIFY